MKFSIDTFRAKIESRGGLSRGAFYGCAFAFPGATNEVTRFLVEMSGDQTYPILCRAVRLPSDEVEPVVLSYFTRKIKIPGARNFGPLTLSFFNTNDYALRRSLEEWQGLLASRRGNARGVREPYGEGRISPPPINAMDVYATITIVAYGMGTVAPTVSRSGGVASVVAQLTEPYDHTPLQQYTFNTAFPTRIGGLEFSADNNDIQSYDVDFEYLDMTQSTLPMGSVLSGFRVRP